MAGIAAGEGLGMWNLFLWWYVAATAAALAGYGLRDRINWRRIWWPATSAVVAVVLGAFTVGLWQQREEFALIGLVALLWGVFFVVGSRFTSQTDQ